MDIMWTKHRWMGALGACLVALVGLLWTNPASATSWTMVQQGTPLSYYKGYTTPAPNWTTVGFTEDQEWTASASGFGIGYGDGDDATLLSDMSGNYLTVYARSHFTLGSEVSSITYLELQAVFDDGFVAYLNGTEIARSHVPSGVLQASDGASAGHEASEGPEAFVVPANLLVQGENVLSVEVHNAGISSSDLSFIPTLWGYDTPPTNAEITRGPFLQQVSRTRALVVWETDNAVVSTVIHGPTEAMTQTVEDTNPKTHHVVELTGLPANAIHYYQVQSAQIPSPMGRFHTEVNRADPYRIAAYGDTRSGHTVHGQVIAGLLPHEPMLALLTGDLVATGSDSGQWDTFFSIETPLLRDVALYPALGNHEGQGTLYVDIFELPENAPTPERFFSVKYATTLLISLDQYVSDIGASSAQVAWLEQTLQEANQDADIRLKLVELHSGPYDSGNHGSSSSARDVLVPLFEQYGVDVVFSGHDHHYERSTVNDVKYVVTGGGGAGLYSVSGDWWSEVFQMVNHYCILDIHGPRLDFTAYELDGSVLDEFTLGDALDECSAPVDCESETATSCLTGEIGEWACIEGACIWNCLPEPGTGGAGGGTGGASSSGSGGASSSGTGGASSSGLPASGGGDDGGCGCRVGPPTGALSALWLLVAGMVWRLRRARRRG